MAQEFGARAVRSTLGQGTDVDACVALTVQVDALLGQAAAHLQQDDAPLACRKGCNFCCHLRVKVFAHEAIALFRYLKSRLPAPVADRVQAALRAPPPMATDRRPCAFLIAGECAAYEVRPGACAAYHSLEREACERAFLDPSLPSATVALSSLQAVALALEEGVSGAIAAEGLSNVSFELHTALAALLANPALIARWRAGRPLMNPIKRFEEPR